MSDASKYFKLVEAGNYVFQYGDPNGDVVFVQLEGQAGIFVERSGVRLRPIIGASACDESFQDRAVGPLKSAAPMW